MPKEEPVIVLLSAVAEGIAATAGGDWTKLAPRGPVTTRDGREYHFDPEVLLRRYQSDGVRIPIDFEHGASHLAAKGHRNDAVGWIEAMEARDDGLYGRVEWLPEAKAALAARSYRYLSPGFVHSAAGEAVYLHHVSLVNAPALANMPALASLVPLKDEEKETMLLKRLATFLGIEGDDPTEEQILDAITALRGADLSASDDAVKSLLIDRAIANAAQAKKDAEAKVDDAIRRGAIPPAAKDWAIATCSADPKGFDTFLEKVGAPYAHLFASAFTAEQEGALRRQDRAHPLDNDASSVAAQLGIDPKRMRTN